MNKVLLIIIAITALISSLAFFAFSEITDLADQVGLAISIVIVILQTVATWFFLASLGAFKRDLKMAYSILAVGIFVFGLFPLQLLVGNFIELDPLLSTAATVLPTLVGSLVMYLGAYQFARILQLRSSWASIGLVFVFAALTGVATAMAPHVPIELDELTVDLAFGSFIGGGTFSFMAGMLILAIKKELGASYSSAMNWLAMGLFVAAFASIHETIIRMTPLSYLPVTDPYFTYSLNLLPYMITAFLLLKAALAFKLTSKEVAKLPENATYLDVINYVAGMVSTPTAVDVALDKMREITAKQATTASFSTEDKAKLMGVYLRLEDYLVTKEPLRNITREQLRLKLSNSFQRAIADHEKNVQSTLTAHTS